MKRELAQAIAATITKIFGVNVEVELSRPDEQFGDYATNVALQLAAHLHQNPREIAAQLVSSDELKKQLADTHEE